MMTSPSAIASPQAAAVVASWAADARVGAATASPVPASLPGVQQFALMPPPARPLIDQQIMEVQERLNERIAQLMI